MAPIFESTKKLHRQSAARPYKTNDFQRRSTHKEQSLDACLNYLSDELKCYIDDARELCEIKLEPNVNDNFWGSSEEPKSDIIAERDLSEIKLEIAEPNLNDAFCLPPSTETFPSSQTIHEFNQSFNPVSNVLNYHLFDLCETEPRGLKLDTSKPKVNALLWRIQEAMRIEKMSVENESNKISEIDKVLRCRSDVPDIDETCEVTINPNLARHPANQRRELQHQLYRLRNNEASKACRMIKNATKEHLLNDVYEMQKHYERLTKRWAMEKAVSAFLDQTLANVRANMATML